MTRPQPFDFARWYGILERRHLADRTFAEVRRSIQALSRRYVQARGGLDSGAALDGAGKRAAFALFYGPLHLRTVGHIVRELGAAAPPPARLLDLGCGTGTASAGWALEALPAPRLAGVDRSRWAADEALWTWRSLGLKGSARQAGLAATRFRGSAGSAILAAWVANELPDDVRDGVLGRLLEAAESGSRVLVVEPIARRPVERWWPRWSERFRAAGGREDEWEFDAELPAALRELDRAAGLDHRRLKARSFYHPGKRSLRGVTGRE